MKDLSKELWVEGICTKCGVHYELPYCKECEAFVETSCSEHKVIKERKEVNSHVFS